MKSILLLFLLINNYNHFQGTTNSRFSIKILDYHFSSAYTHMYSLDNDSVIVKFISGIENEGDEILLRRKLTEGEIKTIGDFLSTINIDSLKSKYAEPNVADGDRKKVMLVYKNKSKSIDISNMYQRDMEALFIVVNKIVGENIKIEYNVD